VNFHLKPHGVSVERIPPRRILREALTGQPDPLHLSLMFAISENAPPASTRASPATSWPSHPARKQPPSTI
jgi:hypothetical protein